MSKKYFISSLTVFLFQLCESYLWLFLLFCALSIPSPRIDSSNFSQNFSGKNGHIAPVRLWYLIKIDVFSRHKHDEYKQSRVLSLTIDLSMHIVLICTSVRCMNECNYDTHACICAKWQQKCHYFDRDIEVEHLHYKYVWCGEYSCQMGSENEKWRENLEYKKI